MLLFGFFLFLGELFSSVAINKNLWGKKNLFQFISPPSLKLFPKNEIWEKWVREGQEEEQAKQRRETRIKSHSGNEAAFKGHRQRKKKRKKE